MWEQGLGPGGRWTGRASWKRWHSESDLGGKEEKLRSLLAEGRPVQRPRGRYECGLSEAQRKASEAAVKGREPQGTIVSEACAYGAEEEYEQG